MGPRPSSRTVLSSASLSLTRTVPFRMVSALLLSAILILFPADLQAAKASSTKTDIWEIPALDSGSESLWDRIEALDGQLPSKEVIEASNELQEERRAEIRFLDEEGKENLFDAMAWYRDPIARINADPLFLDRVDPNEFDLPLVINEDVKRWMRYFLGSGRKYYVRYLARSTRYRPMIESRLKERGMPLDLFYLSMIESGFSPQAYSSVGAAGLWQFMTATGVAYNLRVDWWVDERRDPERATDAAARHLQDLYKMFGDWYLSAAAYNAGAGRIRRALAKAGPGDFWHVAKPGILPSETRNYVPKMIAAAIIGHHPSRYGFEGIKYEEALIYDKVQVPASSSVEVLSRCANLSEKDFHDLNQAIRRWAVPPDPGSYTVYIPRGTTEPFQACMAKVPATERIAFVRHKVRKGESLGTIARRYGISSDAIARMNDINNHNRVYVGMELVIPASPKGASAARVSSESASASYSSEPASTKRVKATRTTWHTVRSGENLASIASRYKVSVSDIKAWNSIRNANHIEAGQRLKIHRTSWVTSSSVASAEPEKRQETSPAATQEPSGVAKETVSENTASSAKKSTSKASASLTHKVQKGETLSKIASKYKVSQSDLCAWNDISDPSSIKVGQTLRIQQGTSGWITYKVRRGDTLSTIADKHKVSVSDIKSWNGLKNSTIYVGQSIKIKK